MEEFARATDGLLYAGQLSLEALARDYGTPTYVYSRTLLEQRWRDFDAAFNRAHLVCFAVKANSCLGVLQIMARLGSGFDVVSGGELARVLCAGGDAGQVVFSGVGKREAEITRALEAGIRCLNIESAQELERTAVIARQLGTVAPVAIRINPEMDPDTHPHIATGTAQSKFGLPWEQARELYRHAAQHPALRIEGIACHIGSQLTRLQTFREVALYLKAWVLELAGLGITLRHINVGGGLGIRYRDETPPTPQQLAGLLETELQELELELLLEPGRHICGPAGVLLTRVEYLKQRSDGSWTAIVDAAMNDLLRPALYDAWHAVESAGTPAGLQACYELAGPVCESTDVLARERQLTLQPGTLLAVRTAGAYGAVMASNYNSRLRPCELLVQDRQVHILRPRQSIAELLATETLLPPD